MSASTSSIVADFRLAPEGAKKIRWVAQHAPVLNAVFERHLCDGSLRGVNVTVCVPLEAKTAYLTLLLKRAGANVALAGTAPGYVQDDVAAAIAEEGVTVFAVANASAAEFEEHLIGAVRTNPALLVDDRAELTRILSTKETALAR
ncbi:MAG: adenosylhomocysteinase, partial [Acidobacteria bacterium]